MNKGIMINAVNDLDDAVIIAAAPLTGEAKVRVNRRRWIHAAVVAVCLVLGCGAVGYAAGWFTKPFEVVTEGITIVDKDGNEVAGKMVLVQLNALKPEELKGKIREDILAQQADAGEGIYKDGIYITETFSSVKGAVEYLGCDKLETPYYPFEMSVDVLYTGVKAQSVAWVSVIGIGEKDGIRCGFTNMFNVNKDAAPGYLGFGLEYYDGYADLIGVPDVSEFDTARGINCKVAELVYEGKYGVQGFLTKNSITYSIGLTCDESDQEKAMQILYDWANSF